MLPLPFPEAEAEAKAEADIPLIDPLMEAPSATVLFVSPQPAWISIPKIR